MLSLIPVKCPHCGAQGQIMIPPMGAIIIGPCPQCSELVVIFCGHVLPLTRTEMESPEVDDRRKHLFGVLSEFLEDRVYKMLTEDVDFHDESLEGSEYTEDVSSDLEAQNPIAQSELERFTDVDLKLLDNKAYFKTVFGSEE